MENQPVKQNTGSSESFIPNIRQEGAHTGILFWYIGFKAAPIFM